MESVWTQTVHPENFRQLKENIKTDVLIIGGGITGILSAYMLSQAGINYVLAESSQILSGVTKNTTAKITVQHGLIYSRITSMYGSEKAQMYLQANEDALEKYAELCRSIRCGYEVKDSCVYSLDNREKLIREVMALEKIGYKAEFSEEPGLPFETVGGVYFKNQAQYNPLEFLTALAGRLNIYENTPVRSIEGHTAITDHANITAKKIIVATHFPFINKHGSYFIKMYQHRSYVLAAANAPIPDAMYVDEAQNGISLRSYEDLTLIGGGGHRTGKQGGCWQELQAYADKYYPGYHEKYRWATQDCMTLDGIPYIGRYSARTPDLYVATGFNKWGMTSAMAAAQILTDMVSGKRNPYESVFSPSRNILKPQLALNACEAAAGFLSITKKRCPHLGCALKWNREEHSWDCSCHGSRFDENGNLIDNPATKDIH
ncbi:MAG: FAD-dependent oxidoreductase [Oscillospiraceae bacterium]|nr:FAD-dependent oxidoreductase [Oscillospiraceae bacterium]